MISSHRLGFVLVALAAALACASAAPAPQPSPASAAPPAPLLWRAQGHGGAGSLFLLGSVHLGMPDTFDLGGPFAEAWAHSAELVVEVNLSQVSSEEAAAATLRHGMLPPERSLPDLVSPATWSRLVEELEALGAPAETFARFKPWLAATTLALLQLQAAGLRAQYGVDQQLIGEAEATKPIVALETFGSQLATMDSLPGEVQELMLIEALERGDEIDSGALRLLESWQRGDEQALVDELFGRIERHPEFEILYEKVYFERNEAMSARLAELARDGKTRFTVLGIGHMVGPRGIPALLAAQGFRVERVR